MICIAVVDDSATDRQALMTALKNEMSGWNCEWTADEYASGEDFLAGVAVKSYTIAFLDIYMTGADGIRTAKQLRQQGKNTKIVFLTTSLEHIAQSFSVNASCYLLKPVKPEELHQALGLCLPRSGDDSVLEISSGKTSRLIRREDILYIDCIERSTAIHTAEEVVRTYTPFCDIEKKISADARFVNCRRGVLLNMNYIARETDGDFLLKNNERIPISRARRKAAMAAYRRYRLDTL